MIKKTFIFLLSVCSLCSCGDVLSPDYNNIKLIKEDIGSRYVAYEVIEIRPDSANVYTAVNTFRALRIRIEDYNSDVLDIFEQVLSGLNRYDAYLKIDSMKKQLITSISDFELSGYKKADDCYFVKYSYQRDGLKIPVEEYYHIRQISGENNYDIIHRPANWNEFLKTINYEKIIQGVYVYTEQIEGLKN